MYVLDRPLSRSECQPLANYLLPGSPLWRPPNFLTPYLHSLKAAFLTIATNVFARDEIHKPQQLDLHCILSRLTQNWRLILHACL